MKLLKYENSKLKNQLIFNLPVSKAVCGRTCKGCYALKAQVRFPKTVLPYRERMYAASLQQDFETQIVADIASCKKPVKAVRIHESGEFYSQAYIDKWYSIAKTIPTTQFYAFTKRIKDFDFTSIMSLPNVIIIDSLMYGGLNYDKLENLDKSRAICPADSCGVNCSYCWTKQAQTEGVQFVKH